jgi:hypothetical protein
MSEGLAVKVQGRGTPHPSLPLKGGGGIYSVPYADASPPPLRGRVRVGGEQRLRACWLSETAS